MKKTKVVRIIARLNIGGPAIHAILLTERLNNQKFESVLVTGMVSSCEGDMSYLAHDIGIKPVVIKELGWEISWRDDLIALWKTFRLLKIENPDIVHTHTAKAGTLGRISTILYNSLSCLNINKKVKRIKVVHTFHGHIFHSYFGWFKTKVFILIERILAIFTDKIITISPEQENDICKIFNIAPAEKTFIIPIGLELKKFLDEDIKGDSFREKRGISNATILVGIVGRLVQIKNHKMYLDSVKILKHKFPDVNAKFLIVGDGELKDELLNYAAKLNINDDVIFTGWQKDLKIIYKALDLAALTSMNEGTPVSLIEAMAAGKAVVSTRVGGVVDLMGKKRFTKDNNLDIFDNGILVKSGDVAAFSKALTLLIKDKSLRDKMGTQGRDFVKERFNIDRLVKDMEKLYESL